MSSRKKLSRKEIADQVGVSAESVRRNEERWGLRGSKVQANRRTVWYDEEEASHELRRRRLIR